MFMQHPNKEGYTLQDFKAEIANPSQEMVAGIKNRLGDLNIEVDRGSIEFSNEQIHGRFSMLEKFPSFIESPALISKNNYFEDAIPVIHEALSKMRGVEMTKLSDSIKESLVASFSPFAGLIVDEQIRFYVKMDETEIQFILELETNGASVSLTFLNLKAQKEPMIH